MRLSIIQEIIQKCCSSYGKVYQDYYYYYDYSYLIWKLLLSPTEDPYPSSSIDLKCKERVTDSDSENGSGDESEQKVMK